MMDEHEFRDRAEQAIAELERALAAAAERYDFEVDLSGGALKIEFEDPPAKFVVSPNSPVRQVWVSANLQSYKLDWSEQTGAFVHAETGQSLKALIAGAVGRHLGAEVKL